MTAIEPTAIEPRPLRLGLVGTGHWAQITHAPALASTDQVEFTAVWGRNAEAAGALAREHGVLAFTDFDAFLAEVDAISFSVPPDVQSELAVRAARAGKHLLLEKPIATSDDAAQRLVDAVRTARVATVVFLTARFQPDVRAWLGEIAQLGGWRGGHGVWVGSALEEGNPFNTPWRRDKGGLWDLGPHVISLLWAALGPVVGVTADSGPHDVAHLVLHHAGGASSTVTVTADGSDAAAGFDLFVWGDAGRSAVPGEAHDAIPALRVALTELIGNVQSGSVEHPCDVEFGHAIGRVLSQAQRQIDVRASSPRSIT
jgi:predicted dehydrogenase